MLPDTGSIFFYTFDPNLLQINLIKHMKKLLLSLAFIAVALFNVMASGVELSTAREVATNFIAGIPGFASSPDLQIIQTKLGSDQMPAYYVFAPSGGEGFVIISAEDVLTPVLGYSATGKFSLENNNSNFNSFIKRFSDQAAFARANNLIATPDISSNWQKYLQPASIQRQPLTTVEPLLQVMWNQDFPYNAYCPEVTGGSGGHVYAGCVATAMSMVMMYYRYPVHGTGSHSYYMPAYGTLSADFGNTYYNWDAMLNSVSSSNGMAINAVAELQYHCGVSVNMNYGPDASGAQSTKAALALKTYFGYPSSVAYVLKANYTSSAWENMIIAGLNEKKPFYYSGYTATDGHAFVLDGYQQPGSGNFFHFNFGWSGTDNGFYTLSDVNGFNIDEGMIINFFPLSNYPPNCSSRTITSSIGTFEDGSGPVNNYINNASCSWLIAPTDSVDHITLNFNLFDTESVNDFVTVYDGPTTSSPVLGVFSGNTLPSEIISTSDRMLVTFTTDGANSATGWQAQYVATYPAFCSGTTILTAPTGSFNDGSGPNFCNNNLLCKWKIVPQFANNVTLSFTSFNLEEGKDELMVLTTGTSELLGTFSGNTIPAPLVSTTGGFLLMFKTNGFNPSQGFDAQYTIDNVKIKENTLFSQLDIFPNPSTGLVIVRYKALHDDAITLKVSTLAGKQVFIKNSDNTNGQNEEILNLSDFSKGMYVLELQSKTGSVYEKLILN
jgi:hypothetical protein